MPPLGRRDSNRRPGGGANLPWSPRQDMTEPGFRAGHLLPESSCCRCFFSRPCYCGEMAGLFSDRKPCVPEINHAQVGQCVLFCIGEFGVPGLCARPSAHSLFQHGLGWDVPFGMSGLGLREHPGGPCLCQPRSLPFSWGRKLAVEGQMVHSLVPITTTHLWGTKAATENT